MFKPIIQQNFVLTTPSVWYQEFILKPITVPNLHFKPIHVPKIHAQNPSMQNWQKQFYEALSGECQPSIHAFILWLDHRTIEFAIGYFAVFNAEYQQY